MSKRTCTEDRPALNFPVYAECILNIVITLECYIDSLNEGDFRLARAELKELRTLIKCLHLSVMKNSLTNEPSKL